MGYFSKRRQEKIARRIEKDFMTNIDGPILLANDQGIPFLGISMPIYKHTCVLTTRALYVGGKKIPISDPNLYSTIKELEFENGLTLGGINLRRVGNIRTTTSLALQGKDRVIKDIPIEFLMGVRAIYIIDNYCKMENHPARIKERVCFLHFREPRCKDM